MHYPKELAFYRTTNFQHPRGLLTFTDATSTDNTKTKILCGMLKFWNNSIHGAAHIWDTDTRRIARLFWLSIVGMALSGCIAMYVMLTVRHRNQLLVTVVETSHLPIYSIRFPSVAVCPYNHVNWLRYKAAEAKFLPPNASEVERKVFYDLVTVIDTITFTLLSPIEVMLEHKVIPPSIQKISLYDLARFMAFRCDELFVWCILDETYYDCCKIFVIERTERGICLVFNSLISEESKNKKYTDNFYPWRVRIGGETSGLSFHMHYNKTLYRPESKMPFGFSILVKESEEWSDSVFHPLYPNTDNRVMVTPIMMEYSRNTRGISPQKRQCLFPEERSTKYQGIAGLPYNKLNCQIHCEEKFVMKHCNCSLSMFFPGNLKYPRRECKVSDLECIYRHKDVFNYLKAPEQDKYINDTRRGMVCDCIDNCLALVFLIEMNSNLLPNASKTKPEIRAEVFYLQNSLTKYVTRLEHTFMDLLAHFGGVLGLCLGSSILSVVEMFYAIIHGIVVFVMRKWNRKRRQRKILFVKSLCDVEK